jgi:hypothetical protein
MKAPRNICKACGGPCHKVVCRKCYIASCHRFSRRLNQVWSSMMRRCHNPRDKDYKRYGGRGIVVCVAWRKYHAFGEWALANGYAEHLTIERIKNNRGYSPKNCKWATFKEQARNRSNNTFVAAFGEIKTISQWAEDPRCRVNNATLIARLIRQRLDPEVAITHPPLARGLKRRYRVFDGHS